MTHRRLARLGLDPPDPHAQRVTDATQAQIKRAYLKLARRYHPDVSTDPQAEARFKEVTAAFEALSAGWQ